MRSIPQPFVSPDDAYKTHIVVMTTFHSESIILTLWYIAMVGEWIALGQESQDQIQPTLHKSKLNPACH
jgi:hypothetical protein